MKINGIDGSFSLPRVNKQEYQYAKFEPTLKATVNRVLKTLTVRAALDAAWNGVVQRSKNKSCNECFRQLARNPGDKKTLAEILAGRDLVLHLLEPKPGHTDDDVPDGNCAGRDIGLHPALFFHADPLAVTCTLIHELAHVGGASTDAGAPRDVAHAAEKTLLSCDCKEQYRPEVLGSIKLMRSMGIGGSRLA